MWRIRSNSKEQNKKRRGKHEARSISHSAIGYQSSLESLQADIKLINFHFINRFRCNFKVTEYAKFAHQMKKTLTLRKNLSVPISYFFSVSISMCAKPDKRGYFPAIYMR